jgi:hypothetical protein
MGATQPSLSRYSADNAPEVSQVSLRRGPLPRGHVVRVGPLFPPHGLLGLRLTKGSPAFTGLIAGDPGSDAPGEPEFSPDWSFVDPARAKKNAASTCRLSS